MATTLDLTYLRNKSKEAEQLAKDARSKKHWAKPYYSDVHLFYPGIECCFVGVNGAGNYDSYIIDQSDENEKKIWSGKKPYHNAYLDERWGKDKGRPRTTGEAKLQKAVQAVFQSIYGGTQHHELRNTACFNLSPVSSDNFDVLPVKIRNSCIQWGISLVTYLCPKVVIAMGKAGEILSTSLKWDQELEKCSRRRKTGECMAKVRLGTLYLKPNVASRMLWLPHLSVFSGKDLNSTLASPSFHI